jgi:hypothetical protein
MRLAHAREVFNGGSGEVPTHCVSSVSVFFMPSGGRLGCSSTAALGPAQR